MSYDTTHPDLADSDAGVQSRIADIFVSRMNLESPGPQHDLFDAGILDSLGLVDLLLHLEREFGFRCSPEDLEIDHFRTITRIAALVRRGLAAPAVVAPRVEAAEAPAATSDEAVQRAV